VRTSYHINNDQSTSFKLSSLSDTAITLSVLQLLETYTGFTPKHFSQIKLPNGHCFSPKVVSTFAGRGCRVVGETDPHGRKSRFSIPEPLPFHASSSSVILTRLSGPRPRPTTSQKV
jgi:hypothetical protein